MARDDEVAETPRRSNTAGGSRGKRPAPRSMPPPPPTGGTLKYDPTQPQAPSSSAYSYGKGHDAASIHGNMYTSYPASTNEDPSSSNKRKRVKKERYDDWAPAPPPPPPPPPFEMTGGRSVEESIHAAVPAILSRSSSVSSSHGGAAYEASYPVQQSTSVFSEVPVAIHSFAETERRRASNQSATNTVNLGANEPVGRTATSKTSSENGSGWSGRAAQHSRTGTLSVFDLFFPDTASPNTRQSKRRRRHGGDAEKPSGTRSSNRRAAAAAVDEVDLHQFAVDKFRLIPQGLVDRIDSRLKASQVARLISDHVDNWILRVGFDDQNFLQETSSLLNAYYPCTYPTILDDVLALFLFKRPELAERMLASMIERLQKTGESASPAKYPIVEAFARRCASPVVAGDKARHDLACLTVLRLLVERNTEKYLLSPWIASCASYCSEEVLSLVWGALLRPLTESRSKASQFAWAVADTVDQVFELLREEKTLGRHAGDLAVCRLSRTLIHAIFVAPTAPGFRELRETPMTCAAFENLFGNATSVAKLLRQWLEAEQRECGAVDTAVKRVLSTTSRNCSRLSIKKTHWFTRHVVPFALEAVYGNDTAMASVVEELVLQYPTQFLGAVAKSELEEIDVQDQAENGAACIVVGKSASTDKHTESDVGAYLEVLDQLLRNSVVLRIGRAFIDSWREQWCRPDVRLPWSYVWGLVRFVTSPSVNTTDGDVAGRSKPLFLDLAVDVAARYTQWILRQPNASALLARISRIVAAALMFPTGDASNTLLRGVLDAILSDEEASSSSAHVKTAVALVIASRITTTMSIKTNTCDAASLMTSLARMASADDHIGRFIRSLVFQARRIDGVVFQVVESGSAKEIDAVLAVIASVCNGKPSPECPIVGVSSIDHLVAIGYRSWLPVSTRQRAIGALQAVARSSASAVLWSVLRQCSQYCCGCVNSELTEADVSTTAVDFANLSKAVLVRLTPHELSQVVAFTHQRLASCAKGDGRWNLFHTLVLDRVLQLGWQRVSHVPKLWEVVVSPFDAVEDSSEDTLIQLRLLRSLCAVVMAGTVGNEEGPDDTWTPVARLASSPRVRAKLLRIVASAGCTTSVALAQSVLSLCDQIDAAVADTSKTPPHSEPQDTPRLKLVL